MIWWKEIERAKDNEVYWCSFCKRGRQTLASYVDVGGSGGGDFIKWWCKLGIVYVSVSAVYIYV